jgi:hypothetical protein
MNADFFKRKIYLHIQEWFVFQLFTGNWLQLFSLKIVFWKLLEMVRTGQKWPFWKGVLMVSDNFHWFQFYYFLTRIIHWFQFYYFLTRIIPAHIITLNDLRKIIFYKRSGLLRS